MALDILCIAVVGFCGFRGARTGVLRQVLRVLCLILAFIVAWLLVGRVSSFISRQLQISSSLCLVISGLAIWVLSYVALRMLALHPEQAAAHVQRWLGARAEYLVA